MGRGILSGLIWGSIISVFVLSAVSLLAPLPQRPGEAGEDLAAVEPEPEAEETAPEPDDLPEASTPPEADATDTPEPDTETADTSEPERPAPATQQTIGEAVSVPAGSEFRRPPPETEAALPVADPTSPVAGAPAVPPSVTQEGGLDLPSTEGAVRPDTPGMSVTAPVAPVIDEIAPEVTADASGGTVSRPEGESLSPVSGPNADSSLQLDGGGLPPAVTPQPVPTDTLEVTEAPTESLAASDAAPAESIAATDAAPVPAEGGAAVVEGTAPPEIGDVAERPAVEAAETTAPAVEAAQAATPATEAETPPAVSAALTSEESDAASPIAPVDPPAATPPVNGDAASEAEVVTASPGTRVEESEPAPTADGEQIAMAEPQTELPGPVAPERVAEEPQSGTAVPADGTDPLPAAPADALPEGGDEPDRPERMEIRRADPGEAAPEVGDEAPTVPGVRVLPLTDRSRGSSRLPQIGREPEGDEVAVAVEPEAEVDPLPGEAERPGLGALSRHAVPFSNPEGKPLFSVILIDDGSRTLDRQVLSTFNFPVTFAIDPALPDAAEAAEFYRSAGFEVVALATGLTPNATARDLEVALEANLAAVPEAVAIMDPAADGIGGRRALVEHAVEIAAGDGLGMIGWDRGLGAVRAASARAGHPAALIFRSLDEQGERSSVIQRYLDRAAFKAAQDGAVVMAGHAQPETVEALFRWAQDDKARDVALAPVSAVLRGQ
ncbi:divergent polysaccharide deacetylase family protein [Tropicimonas aquimaris]|uniref:Divergent polysaccharide deacetylase family protein n=1 Tax=Tropicimonas aquimaris TaxID=914152 RepID=A0ABW3IL03_9RHOB